jgi:glucose/arabinose dehydrogenase
MSRRLAGLLFACLVFSLLPASAPAFAAPPSGFESTVVPGLNSLNQPTAFAFLPSGAMLIATKPGRLLLYQNGALRSEAVFDRSSVTCANSERGLLGVAVDPAFASNSFIYVYYTFDKHGAKSGNNCPTRSAQDPVNRVSRLTLSAGLTTSSETVLVDNIPSPNGNHNAGDLHFGKDGYLYISTGDGGADNTTARQNHNLDGAILRITRDGGIPEDNPFTGSGTARCNNGSVSPGTDCQEIFAFGLRNPFRIAFDPNAAGTRFFINDVGQGNVEEISEGRSGGDFGWNCFEGTRVNRTDGICSGVSFSSTVPPVFEYRREGAFDRCASITGGAFVPAGIWPSSYDGAYLFADYVCGRMFTLNLSGASPTSSLFDGSVGAVSHMAFGPFGSTQALYYANIGSGEIVRISYSGSANRSPTARLSATPTFGSSPLVVAFDGSASSDPDSADTIAAFLWDFGDGTSRETTTPTTSHTFTQRQSYTVTLRVRDSRGAVSTNPASVRIDVDNTPPTATIIAPTAGTRFDVGETITLQGSAIDAEDGPLPGSSLSWEVRRHHGEHFHPYLSTSGATATLVAPAPEDLDAVTNSYLEVRLIATDAQGRASPVVTREIRPNIVSLRLESEPPGLRIAVNDGVSTRILDTPTTVAAWPGYTLTLDAPTGQRANGAEMKLCGTTPQVGTTRRLIAPGQNGTFETVFAPVGEACPRLQGVFGAHLPLLRR